MLRVIITAAALLDLPPSDSPFSRLPKSEHTITQRARGALPPVICTHPSLMKHSTPVLALLALSSQPSWGWFHWRGSKPLNSSSIRESKSNDLDIQRLSAVPGSQKTMTLTYTDFSLIAQEAGGSAPIPDKSHLPPWN